MLLKIFWRQNLNGNFILETKILLPTNNKEQNDVDGKFIILRQKS